MNKMFLKKILLSVLIVSIVSFGLTGCSHSGGPVSKDHCNVWIRLSSTYPDHHYNIYMDNVQYFEDVTVGTHYINNVSMDENHVFTVVHHKGTSFGSVSQTEWFTTIEEDVYFNITF